MDQEPRSGPIRVVLFDMDGVLCRYDLACRLEVLQVISGRPAAEIKQALWDSGFEDAADAGAYPTAETYLAAFAERLGHQLSREQWIAARRSSMFPSVQTLRLAATLSGRRRIALLSNNGPLMKEAFAEIFPEAEAIFAGAAYFSCEFGGKKPDAAVFSAVLDRLSATPAEVLFIDDKAHNADGANAAGLHAIHFTGHDDLVRQLGSFGLP